MKKTAPTRRDEIQQGDIGTIVWAERRLALALTGTVPQAALLAVAQLVHDTMEHGRALLPSIPAGRRPAPDCQPPAATGLRIV